MMLIAAPQRIDVVGPLVFLAGPISRGPDGWHEQAIATIANLNNKIHVANPRRDPDTSAQLWNQREDGATMRHDFPERDYNEQMDWETHYLRRAAADGVVVFWLARERAHRCDRPHAQTTRFELAEWKERHRSD